MNTSTLRRFFIVFCLFIAAPCFGDAPAYPLANNVPDDALLYFGWAGSEALAPAYDGSHLKAVLSSSNIGDVASQLVEQLINKSDDDKDKEKIRGVQQAAALIWKHPSAFYLREFGNGTGEPKFGAALLVDAGSDTQPLLDLFQKAIADGSEPKPVTGSAGNLIWISSPEEHPDHVAAALDASANFKTTMAHLQQSPACAVYLAAATALARAELYTAKDPSAHRIWPAIRDAFGITHVTAYAATAGFEGADWGTASALIAPSPRTGLLSSIEPAVADPALLARVPQDAPVLKVVNFDAAKFLDAIAASFAVDPRANTMFHQGLGAVDLFLGRNLRTQILGSLGPQWVMYSNGSTNFILLNKPTDPAVASDAMVSAFYGICNAINLRMSRPGAGQSIKVQQQTLQGISITSAKVFMFTPSMAVNKGILYFGITPEAVATAATSADSTDTDITHHPGFADAAKRLATPSIDGFTYANLPETAPAMHAAMTMELSMARGMLAGYKIQIPAITLPPLDVVKANLAPALRVNWSDDQGIYSKSITPFLGSMIFGNSTDELSSVGVAALGVSVLLPSLNRARETANRVKCASNERQIGQAILMYSNEHKGKYPPDLGTLFETGDIVGQVFVCPSSGNAVPANLDRPNQIAAWINEHSDYVYVGQNLTNTTAKPDDIVLYEKPDAHAGDGMEFLFGDGHVDWRNMKVAKQLIQQHPAGGNGENGL